MQPKKYFLQQHHIPIQKIDKHAFYVVEKLKQKGFSAYIVGGSVRDLLLGVKPKDFDISTSAQPEKIKQTFKNCILIGKRFRLAHIRFGKKIIEVATFRAGSVEESNLILKNNIWGNEEEDVLRRDFTINGLFYDPENQTIIDYIDGFSDIEKKVLRTIGTPDVRFKQDPVRMIRLLKFKARFDLDIDPPTLEAMISSKNDITKSSPARILEELFRMLESGASRNFFNLLYEYNFLKLLLPKAANYIQTSDDNQIFNLLEQADIFIHKHQETIERGVLISCLLFPLLQNKINALSVEKHTPLLGIIAEEGKKLVREFFAPTFHLSRRIKGEVVSILTHQFRLTPPSGRLKKKVWIPKDPLFPLAMKFFKLRCSLFPPLFQTYTLWNEKIINSHKRMRYKK